MTPERMLKVADVAERLGAHPETIRRWLKSGRLRGVLPSGDKFGWRIPESEIERFWQESESKAEDR
jgi:excisionase family DNA binding protein